MISCSLKGKITFKQPIILIASFIKSECVILINFLVSISSATEEKLFMYSQSIHMQYNIVAAVCVINFISYLTVGHTNSIYLILIYVMNHIFLNVCLVCPF